MGRKILVVDDEKLIVKGIKFSLEQDEYEVDCAYDGEEALEKVRNNGYDLVILDLMLPKMNGYDVCRELREFSDVPVIMLTAKDQDMDKIMGLEYGADDYVTKPFNIVEVKARIKAILRRVGRKEEKEQTVTVFGELTVDPENRRALVNGADAGLTAKEFEILQLLSSNPDKIYDRDKLLTAIWGEDFYGDARTVDVHIRRLREKIEKDPGNPIYIHTKWGIGYYFEAQ
ncbi:MAG: response regulator transcription factor [Lachnospiraceae bacterium]|nr:response regulator transcription factor [Lachnospiraceae bacterium]